VGYAYEAEGKTYVLEDEMFLPLPEADKDSEFIAMQSRTYAADAWIRFKKSRLAVLSLVILGVIVLFAVFGPILSPYTYDQQNFEIRNAMPSAHYLFGTDNFGRDIFTRVMYGARISLGIGFAAATINLIIGVVYGGVSGFLGGRTDMVMMRVVDMLYAIPSLLYVILIMLVFGANMFSVLTGICIASWIGMARIVRSQVLSLKEQEFAMAAKVLGAGNLRILLKHLILNSMNAIIVTMTFMIPNAIFTEAYLSFLGVGITVPKASWGTMAQESKSLIDSYPIQVLWPLAAICITMFALNFIGDRLGDALDPKKHRGS